MDAYIFAAISPTRQFAIVGSSVHRLEPFVQRATVRGNEDCHAERDVAGGVADLDVVALFTVDQVLHLDRLAARGVKFVYDDDIVLSNFSWLNFCQIFWLVHMPNARIIIIFRNGNGHLRLASVTKATNDVRGRRDWAAI